jgi:pimeloyl-ACP methyl ester carboxylesterase
VNTSLSAASNTVAPSTAQVVVGAIATVLMRVLVLLVIMLASLPVLLLPIGTAVPAYIWISFALADLALIVAPFYFKWRLPAVAATLGGALVILLLAIVASQAFAATPAITGARGEPLPGSIATLEKVELNGSQQWITIRGKDIHNPILLNLGMGGPGGGGFATRGLFEPLEDYFTVVSWDEPGTGKSYGALPIAELTPERYISDAYALTQMLRARFHQDKIYVYGVSWTSILGVWLVQRYPDLYQAYIGTGQMVNTTENDILGYQLALKYAAERGDTASVAALQRNGPPPYHGDGLLAKYLAYIDILNDYMKAPRYALIAPIVPVFAPEYGWVDKVNHTRGLIDSFTAVYPQLQALDFTTQAASLDVPVYFFVGRDDVNAMASLVERYYNLLEAPHKELIWLDGGHGLGDANLGQFVDVMVNKVLRLRGLIHPQPVRFYPEHAVFRPD